MAGATAAAWALLARRWLHGVPALALGATVVVVAYLGVIVAVGITDEDRLVARMLRQRLHLGGAKRGAGGAMLAGGDEEPLFDWKRQRD
jgi:hypothetical protein